MSGIHSFSAYLALPDRPVTTFAALNPALTSTFARVVQPAWMERRRS